MSSLDAMADVAYPVMGVKAYEKVQRLNDWFLGITTEDTDGD